MSSLRSAKFARVPAALRLGAIALALACGCGGIGFPNGVLQDDSDLAPVADLGVGDGGYVSPRRDGMGDGIADLATPVRDLAGGVDLAGPPVDDAVCNACEKQQCRDVDGNDWYAYCFLDNTPITDGPGMGKTWAQVCLEVLQCARKSGCAAHDPQACYCGDGVSDTVCLGNPQGACRGAFEAAAETTHTADVVDRLADPSYPVGAAFNLLRYCEVPICGASCVGGATGSTDMATTTPPDLATTTPHDLATTTPPDLAKLPDMAGAGCADLDEDGKSDCSETLLANARFDSNLDGWTIEYGATGDWQPPPDALGGAGSGSIRVTSTTVANVNGVTMAGAAQCIAATAGASYRLFTHARVGAGQGAGSAVMSAQLYASSDCSGVVAGSWTSPAAQSPGAWTVLKGTLTAPANASSMRVRLVALKQFHDPPFAAQFDNPLVETP